MVAAPAHDRPAERPDATRRQPFIVRRRLHREAATRRLLARVVVPILATRRPDDPLDHPRRSAKDRLLKALAYLGLALLVHVGGVGVALLAAKLNTVHVDPDEQVVIELREIAPPPPVAEPPAPEPAPVEVAKPVVPVVARPEPKVTAAVEPPPDPTTPEPPPAPQAEPPKQAPMRVVGLSLDSTSAGGDGPSFAVGNTRMGETASRAADSAAVTPLTAVNASPSPNRVATRIPEAGVTFTKPERKTTRPPPYPELLRQQGIEAEVVVVVSIDVVGKVIGVTIAKGSTYPEFNEAARVAALAEEFTPATKNGEPVPYSLKYTYFFRLTET